MDKSLHHRTDVSFGLVAGLSGLRTTVRSLQCPMPEDCIATLRAAQQMYTGLTAFSGGHFPPASVFASRIIAPTLFAATFVYQSLVRTIYWTSLYHVQMDLTYMVTELPGTYPDMPLPRVVAPSIVAYISPSRGFGVFAALDIPEDKDRAAADKPPKIPVCVATYGGVTCTDKEVKRPNYAYRMSYGELPPHRGRQSTEYVS